YPSQFALVGLDENRAVDQQDVSTPRFNVERREAFHGAAVAKLVVVGCERGSLRFACSPHFLFALERSPKHVLTNVSRSPFRDDLEAEAVGVIVFRPRIHPGAGTK